MTPADLLAAIGTAMFTPEVERMVAIHEAGHAVVTVVLRPGAVVSARIRNGPGPAGTVQGTQETREELLRRSTAHC